jgi:hypothetical protein
VATAQAYDQRHLEGYPPEASDLIRGGVLAHRLTDE